MSPRVKSYTLRPSSPGQGHKVLNWAEAPTGTRSVAETALRAYVLAAPKPPNSGEAVPAAWIKEHSSEAPSKNLLGSVFIQLDSFQPAASLGGEADEVVSSER